jgi:hypothetical protein
VSAVALATPLLIKPHPDEVLIGHGEEPSAISIRRPSAAKRGPERKMYPIPSAIGAEHIISHIDVSDLETDEFRARVAARLPLKNPDEIEAAMEAVVGSVRWYRGLKETHAKMDTPHKTKAVLARGRQLLGEFLQWHDKMDRTTKLLVLWQIEKAAHSHGAGDEFLRQPVLRELRSVLGLYAAYLNRALEGAPAGTTGPDWSHLNLLVGELANIWCERTGKKYVKSGKRGSSGAWDFTFAMCLKADPSLTKIKVNTAMRKTISAKLAEK